MDTKPMSAKQQREYNSLTLAEKLIYSSVMSSFPSTSHESAYDVAIQDGVRWQFIFK